MKQFRMKVLVFFVLALIGFLACNNNPNQNKNLLTDEDKKKLFEEFAKQLETSINQGNYKFLNTSWDIELFKRKVASKGGVNSGVLEGGEKYYRKVIYKVNNDLVDEVKQHGEFHLSKFHYENKSPKAFYTYETDLGINFIEFVFKQKGDKVKIVDFFNFQLGEYYSLSVRKMIRFVNKYGGSKGAYFNAMQLVGLAIKQAGDSRDAEAWSTINAISENLITDNYFQHKRILVASMISNKRYLEALEDFIALKHANQKLQLYYKINLYHNKRNRNDLDSVIQEMEALVGKSKLFTNWKNSL